MKKLIFLSAMLACMVAAQAQTGTIVDDEKAVKITFPDGNKIGVNKTQNVLVTNENGRVYILTSHRWASDRLTRLVSLDPDDFGYASVDDLFDYLYAICNSIYTRVISYEDSVQDTAFYYVGDSLAYYKVNTNTGSLVTGVSAPQH